MNVKGYGRKRVRDLIYFRGICVDGVRKSTKNLSQNSRSPGRGLNDGLLEYKAGIQPTEPRGSVHCRGVVMVFLHLITTILCTEQLSLKYKLS
jgi:hypothetical protein